MSLAWIVTGATSPAYVLSVGVNTAVALPSTTLSVYVPITSPAGFLAGTDSAGCPFSPNNVNELGSSGTSFSTPLTVAFPGLNVTSLDCSTPCTSVVSAGSAVGVTPTIVGV